MGKRNHFTFEKRRKELEKKKKKEAKLARKQERKEDDVSGPPIAPFDNGLDPMPEEERDEAVETTEEEEPKKDPLDWF